MERPVDPVLQRTLYSGYKKRTTLKYEVAMNLETGEPVWVNGPYPGPTTDITIFRSNLF